MKICKYLIAVALSIGLAGTASAISFDVSSLNTNGDPDAPGSWFGVSLTTTGGVTPTGTIEISNLVTAGNGTKISEIYLGVDGSFFNFFVQGTGSASGAGTNFSLDETLNNGQQGRSQATWSAAVLGDPAGGSDVSVINPGESLSITYDLVSGITEQDLIDAFSANPQELGIAFHAQSLPGGYSEKYEAVPSRDVPDGGTTAALLGLALLGMGGVRRLVHSRKA